MVTTIMIVTYIWNMFSIKHYWLHNLLKFLAFIANIKPMRVLNILDTLKINANLNNILTWISQLEVCIVFQYVCDAHKYAHISIHSNKTLRDVPGCIWFKCVRLEKWLLWG